jgi:hypothetical protein
VVVACGGSGGGAGQLPDAAPVVDSLPPAPVTLTVIRGGQPGAGVHVYFLNADNTVVAIADTDATGSTRASMAAGGSVTVLDPFAPTVPDPSRDIELRSYLGVSPGDHLVVSEADRSPIAVTINARELPGATGYDVLTTCGTESLPRGRSTATVTLAGCNGIADVVVIANAPGGASTLYHPGLAVSDDATLDLTQDEYRAMKDVTFHYSHIPSATNSVSVSYGIGTAHGMVGFNSIVFDGSTSVIQDGAASITLRVPDLPGTSALISHAVYVMTRDVNVRHDVDQQLLPAASYELDLAGVLFPDWVEFPHYDATNRRIAWVDGPGDPVPDMYLARLSVSPDPGVRSAAAPPAQSWTWQLAAPRTAGELKLPVLPIDIADWTPLSTDRVSGAAFPIKLPGGYDAIRDKIFDEAAANAFFQTLGPNDRLVHIED